MPRSWSRFLLDKRSVDDRALNRLVLDRLSCEMTTLAGKRPRIIELGAGLGTMVARLLDWKLLRRADYLLLDVEGHLLAEARTWLSAWAESRGLVADNSGDQLRIHDRGDIDLVLSFVCAELGQFLDGPTHDFADLLIANAFLDLVDVPTVLPRLLDQLGPGGLYWFSLNFDGETIFQPENPADGPFLQAYHRSMDERVRFGGPAGDSRAGRHLFGHLRAAGASILAAGASDWVVHAEDGGHHSDEMRFLRQILEIIGDELRKHLSIDREALEHWLSLRRQQIERGELVYIAHQLDFVGRRAG